MWWLWKVSRFMFHVFETADQHSKFHQFSKQSETEILKQAMRKGSQGRRLEIANYVIYAQEES